MTKIAYRRFKKNTNKWSAVVYIVAILIEAAMAARGLRYV